MANACERSSPCAQWTPRWRPIKVLSRRQGHDAHWRLGGEERALPSLQQRVMATPTQVLMLKHCQLGGRSFSHKLPHKTNVVCWCTFCPVGIPRHIAEQVHNFVAKDLVLVEMMDS